MLASAEQRLSRIRVVLCRPTHPGNIGAAARAIKTMGLSQLALVEPKLHPHPESTARASGAVDVLDRARVCATLDEALAGCVLAIGLSARHRELVGKVQSVREASIEAIEHASTGEVAMVFGTETFGLTNDDVGRCQTLAFIPANPDYGSLNLAAAVQIVAYELRMAAGSPDCTTTRRARCAISASSIPSGRAACCRGCGGCSRGRGSSTRR